jgi:hypothetical protein
MQKLLINDKTMKMMSSKGMYVKDSEYKIASHEMVYHYVRDNGHELTIIWIIFYGQKFMLCIMGHGFNGCFVTGAPCLNEGHSYECN